MPQRSALDSSSADMPEDPEADAAALRRQEH